MIDYPKEHDRLIQRLQENPNDMEARADLLRCNCLWAEENIKDNGPSWKNAALAREILQYGPLLLEMGQMAMLDLVHRACSRIRETLFTHPRLTVEILKLDREALYYIENETGHELGVTEDVQHEISRLETNIWYADRGELDHIKDDRSLRHDPIEWTAAWEEVIDQAEAQVDELLKGEPRGMGFCHMYWHTLATVLAERYGIDWRSPRVMNPRVHFD